MIVRKLARRKTFIKMDTSTSILNWLIDTSMSMLTRLQENRRQETCRITSVYGSPGNRRVTIDIVKVKVAESVTAIGDKEFQGCTCLTSIEIPDSVTMIGYQAFLDCTSLTFITIPNSVTTIANRMFQNCRSLTSIMIPDSVTTIDYQAFQNCTSLTSIVIPSSVTTIVNMVFPY